MTSYVRPRCVSESTTRKKVSIGHICELFKRYCDARQLRGGEMLSFPRGIRRHWLLGTGIGRFFTASLSLAFVLPAFTVSFVHSEGLFGASGSNWGGW